VDLERGRALMMRVLRNAGINDVTETSTAFLDGDTLVLVFSSEPDFSHCANIILYTVKQAEANNMQHLLMDCSAVNVPVSPSFKHILDVSRFLHHRDIRVLMLDASEPFKRQVAPLLPDALWIRSQTRKVTENDPA
jgi:hypothetical protein